MKRCFKCGAEKPLTSFYKHKKMKDGHLNKCKDCAILDIKNNTKDYDVTEKGVIRVIYKTQKSNQLKRKMGKLTYTKKKLSEWLYKNNFKQAYQSWKDSGFDRNLKPSVDRIDSLKPYSFNNIQLVTWIENQKLHHYEITMGIGSGGKRCKPVLRTSESDGRVHRYPSCKSAERDIGYTIWHNIKNQNKCRLGFYWTYE